MINYIETPSAVLNPRWSGRNQHISTFIPPQSSVLDLGCGAKDLLKYITPTKYAGVDYYTNTYADYTVDFNGEFEIPKFEWDYIVCSGLLEYLVNVDAFFNKIKNESKFIIVTYWANAKAGINNPFVIDPIDNFTNLFKSHFDIINQSVWSNHYIYIGHNQCPER